MTTDNHHLKDLMSNQNILQSFRIKNCIIRNLINDICQIRKKVSLVFVSQYGRYTCIIEFDIFVMDAYEVNCWVCGNEGEKCGVDYLRDVALLDC